VAANAVGGSLIPRVVGLLLSLNNAAERDNLLKKQQQLPKEDPCLSDRAGAKRVAGSRNTCSQLTDKRRRSQRGSLDPVARRGPGKKISARPEGEGPKKTPPEVAD